MKVNTQIHALNVIFANHNCTKLAFFCYMRSFCPAEIALKEKKGNASKAQKEKKKIY